MSASIQMLFEPRIHRSHAWFKPALLHPAAVQGVFEEVLLRGDAEGLEFSEAGLVAGEVAEVAGEEEDGTVEIAFALASPQDAHLTTKP